MSGVTKPGLLLSLLFIASGCTYQNVGQAYNHDHSHGHGYSSHSHSHGHSHNDGHTHALHHGMVVPLFSAQQQVGFAELKLHDDKGDLELWVTKDEAGANPLDLPLNAKITVSFPDLGAKTVVLQVRNSVNNEDEEGKGNIRGSRTNYFIFPGDTGADAAFLVGKEFSSETVISFVNNGVRYSSESFQLRPHTH